MLGHMRERFSVRPAGCADRKAVTELLVSRWGATEMIVHGERIDAATLPALIAVDSGGSLLGAVTFAEREDGYEVVSLDAVDPGNGVGTALLESVFARARAETGARVWLVTTNDNIDAIRFYQRRGMRLVGVEVGAVDRARALKPQIPLVGDHGIEIHDELEFQYRI